MFKELNENELNMVNGGNPLLDFAGIQAIGKHIVYPVTRAIVRVFKP